MDIIYYTIKYVRGCVTLAHWLHLNINLLLQCAVFLTAPLLSDLPMLVTYESTILVPHCCNDRAGEQV